MAMVTKQSIVDAVSLLDNYDLAKRKDIFKSEDDVDKYEDKISTYLVKLSSRQLSDKDSKEVTELLHVVGDIERMSDHAVNIADVAEEMNEKQIEFSDAAKGDIKVISSALCDVLDLATTSFVNKDLETAKLVEPLEQVIDRLKRKIKASHIQRLKEGNCTVEFGFILSDLLTNYERISDHCSNIAVCLLEIAHGRLDTHEYLSHVKTDGENDFKEKYEAYKAKYSI